MAAVLDRWKLEGGTLRARVVTRDRFFGRDGRRLDVECSIGWRIWKWRGVVPAWSDRWVVIEVGAAAPEVI